MRLLVALVLVALAVRPGAATEDAVLCQYAGTTGTVAGDRTIANPCVAYPGNVACGRREAGTVTASVVVVTCLPAV